MVAFPASEHNLHGWKTCAAFDAIMHVDQVTRRALYDCGALVEGLRPVQTRGIAIVGNVPRGQPREATPI